VTTRWNDTDAHRINPPASTSPRLSDAAGRLDRLADRVRADLHALRHPETDWVHPHTGPDGAAMLDVLVVGGGQGGLAVASQLIRERVGNILVIDKAPERLEGVWNDIGRMPVIRSPKHYPGPDMGLPNLTYEAWHRAAFGDEAWEALVLVPCDFWVEYLCWIRETLSLPVRNEVELTGIEPAENALRVMLQGPNGIEQRYVRRIVLATGHDGTGEWWLPEFIAALPEHLRARAADPIDFAALKGKRVAVLGVGASAGDNAICALDAGAASVEMFCRRDTHRRQRVYRWCITAGFLRHFQDLPDAERWRFMHFILNTRMGMPTDTWERVSASDRFRLHTNADWRAVAPLNDGVRIETEAGPFEADFIISCAGHDQDLTKRAELASIAGDVALWADRYQPPPDQQDDRLGRYPYLGPSFQFLEKVPGTAPHLDRIHDFTFGPTMSFGPSGCSISTLRLSVPMLVAGVTRGLFLEDTALHWESLINHPEMIP
jgi:cation diffusion facilitator CzcD-associated flavoprotein CzcO